MNLLSRQLWSAKSLKKIIQWYKHFLECQAAYTVTNDITRRVKVKHGTAQGGILCPLIWNPMFESFLKLFEKGPISVVGFADDAALVAKGISASVIRVIMNEALKQACDWGKNLQLRFVPQKTAAIFFHRKKNFKEPKKLKIDGIEIDYQKQIKFLGIHLDTRLNWKYHINQKIAKAKSNTTLEFLIKVDPQISIDPGKFGQINKRRPSNKRRL